MRKRYPIWYRRVYIITYIRTTGEYVSKAGPDRSAIGTTHVYRGVWTAVGVRGAEIDG